MAEEVHAELKRWLGRNSDTLSTSAKDAAERLLCSLWYVAHNPPDRVGLKGLAADAARLEAELR
jgi:hypothetical protein